MASVTLVIAVVIALVMLVCAVGASGAAPPRDRFIPGPGGWKVTMTDPRSGATLYLVTKGTQTSSVGISPTDDGESWQFADNGDGTVSVVSSTGGCLELGLFDQTTGFTSPPPCRQKWQLQPATDPTSYYLVRADGLVMALDHVPVSFVGKTPILGPQLTFNWGNAYAPKVPITLTRS